MLLQLAAPGLGQDAEPCQPDPADGNLVCFFVVEFPAGLNEPYQAPIPYLPSSVVDVRLHTTSAPTVDFIFLAYDANGTRHKISQRYAAQGDARATDFEWLVHIEPAPGHQPMLYVEEFTQNDEEGPPVNPLIPPVTVPATYEFTLRFHPTVGDTPANGTAGGPPEDLQLEDAKNDAPSYFDLAGGWFDDPILDDGLLTVGLVVPKLAELSQDQAEATEYRLAWNLLGQTYQVMWGSEGLAESPIIAMRNAPAVLFQGVGEDAVRLMDVRGTVDAANGTLAASVPLMAIGSPANETLFDNFTATASRVLYRSTPFTPLGAETPALGVEVLDEASTVKRAFALGGPLVWDRLRGLPPPPPPQQPAIVAPPPPDPWASALPLGVAGVALGLGALGLVVVLRRQRAAPAEPPAPGVVFLGKYHIDRELGRGAAGAAWLALHLNLRRNVVIKQLHAEHREDKAALEAFRAEARTLAALDHPHVARVHDIEVLHGVGYIVMEYVDGGSLEDRLAAGPLPVEEATRYTAGILEGLAYIHERGVLHLDVKPANVLLTSSGVVKIVDFGVAQGQDRRPPAAGQGVPVVSSGSPFYQAPEVFQGKRPDARADLYAVGVTFYQLVTGSFYLEADPFDLFDIQRAVVEKPPLLPLPQLAPRMNAWLDRALAKDPARRFQNAEEMRRALLAAVQGQASVGLAPGPATAPAPPSSSAPAPAPPDADPGA